MAFINTSGNLSLIGHDNLTGHDGFLGSDFVVFYHNMDSFTESIQEIVWDGVVRFVEGQIGFGNATFARGLPIFGAESNVSPGRFVDYPGGCVLESGRILLTHSNQLSASNVPSRAMIATISGDSVSFSSTTNVGANSTVKQSSSWSTVPISATKALWALNVNNDGARVFLMNISGSTITPGSGFRYGSETSFSTSIFPRPQISLLTPSGFILSTWKQDNSLVVRYASIISDVIIFENEIEVVASGSTGRRHNQVVLDESRVFLSYIDPTDTNKAKARILNVSGSTITLGDAYILDSGNNNTAHAEMPCTLCAEDKVCFIRHLFATDMDKAQIAEISGDVITLGPVSDRIVTESTVPQQDMIRPYLTTDVDDHVFVSYGSNSFTRRARITGLEISGNNIVVNGTAVPGTGVSTTSTATLNTVRTFQLPDARIATFWVTGTGADNSLRAKVGTIVPHSEMRTTSEVYPSVSDANRIVLSLWSNNLISDDTTAIIERDQTIRITQSGIYLGNAVWSGSTITDLYSQINNGNPDMLVLDFEHISDGNWSLKHSVNGSGYVVAGQQTAGSQSVTPGTVNPRVYLQSTDEDIWIDEVILWAGDKSVFTSFTDSELGELFNLHYLGDNHLPSDEFGSFFALPDSQICNLIVHGFEDHSESCDMCIYTHDEETNNLNLFLKTDAAPDAEATTDDDFLMALEQFFKTSDYDPVLIGRFDSVQTEVNIQVWNITSGVNQLVDVSNSGCYPIGDTGRWGWSTSGMPPYENVINHFLYRMNGDIDGESFVGEFIIKTKQNSNQKIRNTFNN